jgi:hypothetical protein
MGKESGKKKENRNVTFSREGCVEKKKKRMCGKKKK